MGHDILLEAGTNEVEFLEFYLDGQSFGINVAKVKQLIRHNPDQLTHLPDVIPSVIGALNHLGRSFPIVNLGLHLRRPQQESNEYQIVIIADFNKSMTGFLVDGVNKIHRITWNQLQPISAALEHLNARITGIVLVEGRKVLILDFEHILDDINPESALRKGSKLAETDEHQAHQIKDIISQRRKANIYFAEDSSLFRQTLLQGLQSVGYESIQAYENGRDLLQAVERLVRELRPLKLPLSDRIDLVLTDIEMPQLDGLTLCKHIKELDSNIPVVVLSSLITAEMQYKCEVVGANANISKKDLNLLLQELDRLSL